MLGNSSAVHFKIPLFGTVDELFIYFTIDFLLKSIPFNETCQLFVPRMFVPRKYCSAQDLAASEEVSPATGGSMGDGTPIGKGFLAYLRNMKFGVRVSSGNIGE